jgi:hypothetical protein
MLLVMVSLTKKKRPGETRKHVRAVDGMIFKSAEKRLLAKASSRWVRVSITLIRMFVSILARLRRHRNGVLLAAAAVETFSGEAQ